MAINYSEYEILLVDDNVSDVELTKRILKEQNLSNSVFVIRDGEEALEFVFATGRYKARDISVPPKVIFLDLKLPKVSGIEVLRKIKADERTKLIPVVIVSSSKETKDVEESYKIGANSFIQKPIEFDNFRQAITNAGLYWMVINKFIR